MASHWFGDYNKNSQNNLKKIMTMTDPVCLFSRILCCSGRVSLTPSAPATMAGVQSLKHAKPFTTCLFFFSHKLFPRITWCDQLRLSFQPQLMFLKETVSNFPTWDDPFPLIHSIPVWAHTPYNSVWGPNCLSRSQHWLSSNFHKFDILVTSCPVLLLSLRIWKYV